MERLKRPHAQWAAVRLRVFGLVGAIAVAAGAPQAVHADACPEPNNQPANACFLPPDAVVQGFISSQDDRDVYRIEVPAAGTRVRIELTDLPADYDLALVTGDLDSIGESVHEGTGPETLELTMQAPGNYFVYVFVDPNRPFDPNTPYTLRFTSTAKVPPPTVQGPPETTDPTVATTPPSDAAAPATGDTAPATPPAPLGDPWVGDLKFGYDASGNGSVPTGGKLPAIGETVVYAFFSWRNIPPGAQLSLKLTQDKEVRYEETRALPGAEGRTQIGAKRAGGSGTREELVTEGSTFPRTVSFPISYNCEVVLFVGGKEIARGWFTIG